MATTVVDPNESVQASLTALTTVMLTIATTAVVLRCWAVYADSTRKLGLDDIFATAALVSANAIHDIAPRSEDSVTSNADKSALAFLYHRMCSGILVDIIRSRPS